MNLSREDLAKRISSKVTLRQKDAVLVIDTLLSEIIKQFQAGNTIELREFGTLYPFFKKGRTYVVPRTKEEHSTPGYITLKFKPSKKIRIYPKLD